MDKIPNVTTGGNALKFYSMMRLELMTNKPSSNLSGAMVMRVKLNKTKVAPPIGKGPIELEFIYGKGFDPQFDLMMLAKSLGILRLGSGNKVTWAPGQEAESICKGGAKGFREWALIPDNFEKLKAACLATANPTSETQPTEEVAAVVEAVIEEEQDATTSD